MVYLEPIRASEKLYSYVSELTQDLSIADHRLFLHLLISTVDHYKQYHENSDGRIPVNKHFITDHFTDSNVFNLEKAGLITIYRGYQNGYHPRHYKVKPKIVEKYIELLDEELNIKTDYDLSMKQLWRKSRRKATKIPLHSNHLEEIDPPLVHQAVNCISFSCYNRKRVEEHLDRLKEISEKSKLKKDKHKYINDLACYRRIKQLTEHWNGELYRYIPEYTMQKTGRVNTAMQSCSREMKLAAYGDHPELIHNYDLSSSQFTISLLLMDRFGIECPFLKEYVKDKTRRRDYAAQLGISEDDWKRLMCIVILSAHIPGYSKQNAKKADLIKILIECLVEEELVKEAIAKMRVILEPLLKPLKELRKALEKEALEAGKLVNPLGLEVSSEDLKTYSHSAFMAHILHGTEAYFIHTLTTLGEEYGFVPIGNEHDGLITLGEIPKEAIEKAKNLTGLHSLELRLKPFYEVTLESETRIRDYLKAS